LGIPFIIGKEKTPLIIKYLEYTVLYRSAKATGLGFSGRNSLVLDMREYKLKAIFNVFYDYMLSLNKVKSLSQKLKKALLI
jgi:hypothetical protein